MKDKNIIVIMGGPSTENEVSRNTGRAILTALQARGYKVQGLELKPEELFKQLAALKCDVVFNAVHGKFGEDGCLQGALELIGMPYTGSGVLASAVSMNKIAAKRVFAAEGISTPKFTFCNAAVDLNSIIEMIKREFSLPVVVKSSAQGSSIGVVIVDEETELRAALQEAFRYDDDVLIEEFIRGRELTAAVWGSEAPEALPVIEIVPHSGKYDYQSKYTKGATDYLVPAPLTPEETDSVQKIAVQAFKALGCRGVARVDLMLDAAGVPYALEVNSVPGMTATSLVPKAAQAAGVSFEELCERLLQMAVK